MTLKDSSFGTADTKTSLLPLFFPMPFVAPFFESVSLSCFRGDGIVLAKANEMAVQVKMLKKAEGDGGDEGNNERFMTGIESRRRFYQAIINQIAPTEM
ncbi:hypothetical protein F2P81_023417 [Xyrichtys novacula]|uniref:Uncharacterized protein n=1 Tax=Xyrichtys novacula TaxID=13765 RepID=A0AAV1HF08_XYRNO|nr:hypothetical protein F2P81_023417 [Xyrichtys novacula]